MGKEDKAEAKVDSPKLVLNRIGAVLKEKGMSNEDLAGKIKVAPSTVSQYVTNTVQPSPQMFFLIALVTGSDVRELFVSLKDRSPQEKDELMKELLAFTYRSKRTKPKDKNV
ncbi:helix-turn-helix transcriptional regulator [Chitinophaga varians]|uniref:Helix-turn-helix transcriptional regulator n=1 Tax=Chitinophaga varians TaxID=2202339 RepID=A0A847S4Y0_9BACT|nr:helix-turn-helix transcriptional regulator [Chitinophaga varians]NLR67897.1 helix-turn-helix transcriptional regulator [Chitinophaga varians]